MHKRTVLRGLYTLVLLFAFCTADAMADEAVFSNTPPETETVNLQPVPDAGQTASEVNAVSTKPASESLSNEKFKSAVNNLESAQVDVREQLSVCKTKVDEKTIEVSTKKAELSTLKKEYRELQKKMKNIDKMKKMLNNNID